MFRSAASCAGFVARSGSYATSTSSAGRAASCGPSGAVSGHVFSSSRVHVGRFPEPPDHAVATGACVRGVPGTRRPACLRGWTSGRQHLAVPVLGGVAWCIRTPEGPRTLVSPFSRGALPVLSYRRPPAALPEGVVGPHVVGPTWPGLRPSGPWCPHHVRGSPVPAVPDFLLPAAPTLYRRGGRVFSDLILAAPPLVAVTAISCRPRRIPARPVLAPVKGKRRYGPACNPRSTFGRAPEGIEPSPVVRVTGVRTADGLPFLVGLVVTGRAGADRERAGLSFCR